MRTKEKVRSRPWTKSFPSAGRRQQFNLLMLCGKWPLHGCVVPAQKPRNIYKRRFFFGEGRKPSAPAAVQQQALGRGHNLVCRFPVWMHRHLSGQFIRRTNFREFPRLLAEACGGQSTGKADRSAQLDARALQG